MTGVSLAGAAASGRALAAAAGRRPEGGGMSSGVAVDLTDRVALVVAETS
jgi:hypothetical protein